MTDWRALIASPEWSAQMLAAVRLSDSRVEVIDGDGTWLADVYPDSVEVTFDASLTGRYKGKLGWVDSYPDDPTDLLHPFSGNLVRVWWREWIPALGVWGEVLVMTGTPEDPDGDLDPGLGWQCDLYDAATEVLLTQGYGGQSVDVSGQTVDVALGALLDAIAPGVPRSIPATTVTLPAAYTLGANKPGDDIAAICKVAGWSFCSDRTGTLTVDTGDVPSDPLATWAEGDDDCHAEKVSRSVETSGVYNAVRITTSSADIVPALVGVVTDDSPSSPTYIGNFERWYEDTTDAATTQDAVDAVAATTFAAKRYPVDSTKVTARARPDLMARSLISLAFPDLGIAGAYLVQGWSLTMPKAGTAPEPMTITFADRSVTWTT